MKLLYIVPKLNNEGGVARVLSLKLNYLIQNFGYEIHVLTQNNGNSPLFYNFHEKIIFHDMMLEGSIFNFFYSFQKSVNNMIKNIQPAVIVVCDNGLKAFAIPFLLATDISTIFECHGSKYVEESGSKLDFISRTKNQIKYQFKNFGASKFSKFVSESEQGLSEWNLKNGLVIVNPNWIQTEQLADLKAKRVLAFARNSYEKGLERLLVIWQKVSEQHPDWVLDIYGANVLDLAPLVVELGIAKQVNLNEAVKDVSACYLQSSIFAMASRSEGFGMVLLEAMSFGLPCIAYDCPIGPRTIIQNEENGFLIEDGNVSSFVQKMNLLIEDQNLRIQMSEMAKESIDRYQINPIMAQWKSLFESLTK